MQVFRNKQNTFSYIRDFVFEIETLILKRDKRKTS